MTTLVEPYVYVRAITLGLGALWTIQGAVRTVVFTLRWEARLVPMGLAGLWFVRVILVGILRATILDPINLGLLLTLIGLWSFRALT